MGLLGCGAVRLDHVFPGNEHRCRLYSEYYLSWPRDRGGREGFFSSQWTQRFKAWRVAGFIPTRLPTTAID